MVLYPEGCQKSNARKCKLGAELTYNSSRDGLVWQTDKWQDEEKESGTTDGASIPEWAQPIIGDPYDELYLKAAIVHDHYCYKENHVRTWVATHLMFYDALIDLGVNEIKAKTMYFAVFLFGPHWITLVPGENCGENCIKYYMQNYDRFEDDQYRDPENTKEIYRMQEMLENNPEMTLNEIEKYAKAHELASEKRGKNKAKTELKKSADL